METIILVTVLSTLGVVAMVTSIVVMAFKLRNKVDGNSFEGEVKTIYNEIEQKTYALQVRLDNESESIRRELNDRFDSADRQLEHEFSNIHQKMNNETEEIRRTIDSRLDKLDSKLVNGINHLEKELEFNEVKNKIGGDILTN
jgi:hypothetical protein